MLAQLIAAARARNLPAAVMTFEPHPREFFTPDNAPTRLTNLREKLELLRDAGIDQVYVCRFNHAFAAISADDFMTDILHRRLATQWLLVGDDFCFGAQRTGTSAQLADRASALCFEFTAMQSVEIDGQRISSTLVRSALAAGDLKSAQVYLGRPYSMSGKVIHGDKIGRALGFPTANIQLKHNRPPVVGIFAVKLRLSADSSFAGVASLGTRPTITSNGGFQLEVHLFNFSGDLYGQHAQVEFLHKLRDEARYPDLETLTAQIARDVEDAKDFFLTQ